MSTEENVEQLIAEYEKMDANAEGKLTRKQFVKMLKTSRNMKNRFIFKLLFFFTESTDKYSIDFNSFVKLAKESYQTDDFIRTLCKKMLETYDENKDGEINLEEFEKVSEFINRNFPYTIPYDVEAGFKTIDSNDDGKISVEEMEKFFQEKNQEKEEESLEKVEEYEKLKAKFAELDKDNDGLIDFETFKELNKEIPVSADEDEESINFAFATMDKNRDKKVSLDDLYRFANFTDEFNDIPEEEAKELLNDMFLKTAFYDLDKDNDGFVDLEEFCSSEQCGSQDREKNLKEFNEIDLDKDGKISYEDMKKYIQLNQDKE